MPLLRMLPLMTRGITTDASSWPSISAWLGAFCHAELAGLDVNEFDGDSISSSSPAVVMRVAGDATPRTSVYEGDRRGDGGTAPFAGAGAMDDETGSWFGTPDPNSS